jgi:mitochondrial protein MBA1
MNWQLITYLEGPKVVVHRAGPLPFNIEGAKAGIRQAVVRMVSKQRVTVGQIVGEENKKGGGKEEKVEWRDGLEQTATEYMVLQRRMIRGKEEPWMVWGFTKESPIEQLTGGGLSMSNAETKAAANS